MPQPDLDITNLHARMIRDLFLRVELLLNEGITELSEYDIQSILFLYFRRQLISYNTYQVERESSGKVDCVLKKDGKPLIFYEIKTFFKNNEKIKEKHFIEDINKLNDKLLNNPGSKCYFVIAGLKKKIHSRNKQLENLIESHIQNNSRKRVEIFLNDNTSSILRPGRKQIAGISMVVSWELKH